MMSRYSTPPIRAWNCGACLNMRLFPSILVPAFISELSLAVWLTVKGVNLARWREMTERSASALL